jgi:hypothetical protein
VKKSCAQAESRNCYKECVMECAALKSSEYGVRG